MASSVTFESMSQRNTIRSAFAINRIATVSGARAFVLISLVLVLITNGGAG